MNASLGIDTGGTFTDFVLASEDGLMTHKCLSTPRGPDRAILQGISELHIDSDGLRIVHGSTVATNAVLEDKGVRTVFICNRGLRDLLTIGRQARRELYNLQPQPLAPPVPRELCLETAGRLGADGSVIEPLTERDLAALARRVQALAPEAVAINLLYSFLDPAMELAIAACMPEGVFVSRSSAVLPEYREYERGMTTWLNAAVGPLVHRYLQRLSAALPRARLAVMQSAGGTIDARQAGEQAVHMLLSGPAAGLAGARYLARRAGRERALTLDMGGTSTDVALIDGAVRLTTEGTIGGYPVAVPMVDMHTIGAGGGSIARVDGGGLLQVGPISAGADPGPACYGRGGSQPTVTDANLVLGRLPPGGFLGGTMKLDMEAACGAVATVARPLGLEPAEAALGIVRVANEHMAQALRVISVQRGVDPRGFTLVSFGGAGGLHVCALARALGMRRAMVPVHAGVLSALGMLVAPRARQLSVTVAGPLGALTAGPIDAAFHALEDRGRRALLEEDVAADDIGVVRALDLRYRGQAYSLTIPWQGMSATEHAFHETHAARYGHRLPAPVECVNVRLSVHGPTPDIRLPAVRGGTVGDALMGMTSVYGITDGVPVYERARLPAGRPFNGPAVIGEALSTTYLEHGWEAAVDGIGNLLLERHDQD
jgi:N-methylhydantoinase A